MTEQNDYSEKYDIFLSYRREGGETMAMLMRDRLTAKGYRVFLDIEGLNSGSFNAKLLSVIESCTDILVICSKGSLDRCSNDGDWVRKEVAHAFKHGKNVIPVMLRGFEWPSVLPEDISELMTQNGVNADSNEYFDAAVDRLAAKFLKSTPVDFNKETFASSRKSLSKRAKGILTAAAELALVALLVIGGIALWNKGGKSATDGNGSAAVSTSGNNESKNGASEPLPITDTSTEPFEPPPATSTNTNNNNSPPTDSSNTDNPVSLPATNAVNAAPEASAAFITIKDEQYSTALYELDLSNMGLSNEDIVPLKHMTNLEVLNLGGNQISDLSPLSDLTSLAVLYFYDNTRVSDLAPLRNLTNLTRISMYWNQIEDLTPLAGLEKLEWLTVNGNQISDLSPLASLNRLTFLDLTDNRISDLTPLKNLENLSELNLKDNPVADWSPVEHIETVYGRP